MEPAAASDLTGKVAFITGASRGVGKAIALALAKAGLDVVVAAKSTESSERLPGSIHETANEVRALGRRAVAAQVDVRDEQSVDHAVAQAVRELGRIDVLVNNAGAMHWHPMLDTPMKRFDLVLDVNARGAFACTRAVLPHMIEAGWGHVIMMSPPVPADGAGAGGKIAYAISKFGMTLIAHGLAEEVRDHNVACNALWPATLIESYATINHGLGGPAMWRKADILVDAVLAIVAKEPRAFTGHALIDEDFLRAEGVKDFTPYRCDPATEPPRIGFAFKATAGRV
jgi:citronellol/citronellal dehydrogenase